MASGNLGELWFNLGVKDSTSKTFNGILRSLKETDGSVSALRQKLEELKKTSSDKKFFDKGLRGAIKNAYDYLGMLQTINKERSKIAELKILNKDAKDLSDLERADGLLKKIKSDLMDLQKKKFGGVDVADLMPYQKALANTLKDVRNLSSAFQGDNSLSVAASNAARLKIELEKVSNKLSEIYSKQSDGMRKGYNMSYLLSAGNTLRGVKNRIGNMLGSDDLLSNESKFKSLISDIAYASEKAKGKLAEYNREKSRSIELDRNSKKEWTDKVNSGFKGGSFVTPGSKEAAQGYLDIANAYKKAVDTLQTKHGDAKINLTRLLDEYNKEVKELESKIKSISPKMDGLAWNGKKLSPKDLAAYEGLVKQLEHLKNTKGADSILAQTKFDVEERKIQRLMGLIKDYEQLSERVARGTYKPYDANSYEQKRISDTAALKNAIIERYNVEQEAKKKKKKDDADAERQSKANEKQRQTELENSFRRIQSMEKALANLQEKRFTSKMFGLDTSEAEAKINTLKEHIRQLYEIAAKLDSKDMTAVGKLGNLGNGRETQAANDLARSYDRANKQAEKGIEIERKRQLEIERTGAKIQSDLVRGFEKANSHAGKLNSTIQDLKSLFLQGGLVFGAQQFAMSIITTGGEMEKQHIALQSILGDMQNANTLFGQIKELALNSPFTFSELNRDVKQLAAYGVEYDQLYDTTKRLADMSSGLGVSFDRIALAFGQVQARGWLDGKELRQIAYAGIPLLDKLSDFYSKQEGRKVSTSEIKTRISNREVSFDDVKNIFWQMTDAGGQFYNMQQTLSETLLGRYNKLKDAWEIMLADFASGKSVIGGTFMMAIDLVTKFVQSLHSLGPVVAAAFSGIALTRFTKSFGGNAGAAFLANKARMSDEILRRRMAGEALSPYEKTNFVANRGRITTDDLKTLTRSGQLNKLETQRLYLAGRITTEQYKQTMEMLKQRGAIAGLNAQASMYSLSWRKVGLSIKFAGLGILNAGKGLISMLGGLPGIALTGITMAVSYFMNKNAELKQAMEQTASELEDRKKSISEFLRDNKTDSALKNGDEKEISNLIDAYKEKLKEIAPERKNAFEFGLAERKGNEERLKYLEEQLRLMREIAKESEKRLSDDDKYSSFDDAFQDAKTVSEKYSDARAKANMVMATQADFSNFNAMQNQYDEQIAIMRNKLINELGDISKDPKLQGQASQIMSSFFDKNGWDQDVADQFRADVLNAMGVETDFYEEKFKDSLSEAVNKTFPWIGDKVRNDKQLTDAENEQVRNMMKDAAAQIQKDYPNAADTLKRLLASDRFEAVIHLVFSNADDSPLSKQLGQNLTGTGETYHKKSIILNKWKNGENDVSKIESNAKSSIDSAKKRLKTATEMFKKGKLTVDLYNEAKDAYDLEESTFIDTFGYSYTGSEDKKKSKKTGSSGRKEDKKLDDLKKRISLYKKMYAEIKKFKDLYGKGALGQLANDKEFEYIFNNKKLFPISDYTNYETSIKELLGTLPANTKDRVDFNNDEKAGIQSENRKLLEKQRMNELSALGKELDVIKEQYDTYKRIYELTGNKVGAQKVAFGGTVQYDTYKKFLEEQLDIAVKHDNVQSGLSYSTDDIKNMSLENVKDQYGEETRVYDIRKKLEDETNKIKKETIDLMADLIEKNATIAQQIDDENRSYERQLEIIKGIEDPAMRQRAKEGATKTHNENKAKLQFEQFKQESDWVTIFDDLDRVSSATIDSMVSRIDEFSRTTGLSVEVVKQLRDALDNLRKEQIDRNPLPYIFGGVKRGNAIGSFIKDRIGKNASGDSQVFVSSAEGKKMGIVGNKAYTKNQLENEQQGAYDDSSKAINAFAGDMQALSNIMGPVVDLFTALGEQDSVLGKISGGLQSGFSSAASVSSGLNALGLSSLGPYGAAAAAGLSVASSLISAFGADYSSYNKAKEQYDNLSSIWDSLISKKTQYMSIHWGTEATEASKEAQRMLEAEIEQTRIIAQKRLDSGASAGSHSIRYRMWKGSYKYDGQNWQDVASEISRKYGVQFNGMDDLLNMNSETLSQIKQDYVGLWANMDGDFRDYLEKLIEYGEQADDMIDNITEKLTGNKFSSLVESWGDAMSQMSNSSDSLVDNFEDNLKKTIVNSMIENLYKDKINAVLAKAKKYGDPTGGTDNITNANGDIVSAFTGSEYSEVMGDVEDVAKQIEATRDFLKKTYGWSDNSSSSSTNSVKGITEETADILVSYANAIRLDCSVIRAEQAKYFPEMSEIAKSQLTQLNMITQNTLRNAEAAERIESIFTSYNDNFNKVLNGTKRLNVK